MGCASSTEHETPEARARERAHRLRRDVRRHAQFAAQARLAGVEDEAPTDAATGSTFSAMSGGPPDGISQLRREAITDAVWLCAASRPSSPPCSPSCF